MNKKFILSVLNILTLCIVIAAVSVSFIEKDKWMGIVLIMLSVFCLVSLIPFKINLKSILPDIFFGIIDNGILAIIAIFGGHFAGVGGAIIGGVVGNAITDGIAGIFEGQMAEKLRLRPVVEERTMLKSAVRKMAEKLRLRSVVEERTMLKSAVGKMAGCLLGAGIVLVVNSILKF